MDAKGYWPLVSALAALSVYTASAQDRTIPEIMAAVNHDVTTEVSVELGTVPPLDMVLRGAEIVVRGVVSEPRSYMSDDQKIVLSEYTIAEPRVVDDPNGLLAKVGLSGDTWLKLTLLGGTVTVYGRNYTLIDDNVPQLVAGGEYVFLLKRDGKTFRPSSKYFGVFQISENKLIPVTTIGEFGADLRDLSVDDAIAHIIARRQAAR